MNIGLYSVIKFYYKLIFIGVKIVITTYFLFNLPLFIFKQK